MEIIVIALALFILWQFVIIVKKPLGFGKSVRQRFTPKDE